MRIPSKENSVLSFFQVLLFAIGACDASDANQDLGHELEAVNTSLEKTNHAKRLADNAVLRAEGAVSKRWVKAKKTNRAFQKAEAHYIATEEPKNYKPIFTSTPAAMEKLAEAERRTEFERIAAAGASDLPALMKPAGKKVKAAVDAWVASEKQLATKEVAAQKAGEALEASKVEAITALNKFAGDLRSRSPDDTEEQESYAKPAPHAHKTKPTPTPNPAPAPNPDDKKPPAGQQPSAPTTPPAPPPPVPTPGPIASGEGQPAANHPAPAATTPGVDGADGASDGAPTGPGAPPRS